MDKAVKNTRGKKTEKSVSEKLNKVKKESSKVENTKKKPEKVASKRGGEKIENQLIKETKRLKKLDLCQDSFQTKSQGMLLSIGTGDAGQLGLGSNVIEVSRPSKVKVKEKIIQIAAGGMHSLALTSEGKVYSFGCNDEATLGRKTEEEDECFEPILIPSLHSITQVSAGDSHSVALDDKGQVYIWGTFRDINGLIGLNSEKERMKRVVGKTQRIKYSDKEFNQSDMTFEPSPILQGEAVVKLASGSSHILCLTKEGEVYSLGSSDFGQLGRVGQYFSQRGGRLGIEEKLLKAEKVRFSLKNKKKMVDIWAGSYVSFSKDISGNIYSWGLNNYYQLGNGTQENILFPIVATEFQISKNWREISAGEHHIIALDDEGLIYGLGRGDYGRLGLGDDIKEVNKLTKINKLAGKQINEICCGSCVSMAIDDKGQIYSWGMGTNKQLGHLKEKEKDEEEEEDEDVWEPKIIEFKNKNLKGLKVKAGGHHTLLLVSE